MNDEQGYYPILYIGKTPARLSGKEKVVLTPKMMNRAKIRQIKTLDELEPEENWYCCFAYRDVGMVELKFPKENQ